jgi:hypothetical protein
MNKQTSLLWLTLSIFIASPLVFADEEVKTDDEATSEHVLPHELSPEQHKIIRKKFREHRGKMAEGMFQELDANGDEMVDLNEFLSHSEARFNAMDADSDGLVTKEEAREHHRELRKKHHKMRIKMHEHRMEKQESEE